MSKVLEDLLKLLELERIEENLFRGASQDLGFHQLFGGQVLGQSLSAASQTVPPERHVHSLHGYFLRPGDAALPVVYSVDPSRESAMLSADASHFGAISRRDMSARFNAYRPKRSASKPGRFMAR